MARTERSPGDVVGRWTIVGESSNEFKDMITKQYNHFVSPDPNVNIVGMLERVDELTKFHREAA